MKQKKIMLLGGISYLLPVIKAAHEQGYYVITADYLPDNIAHKYSDEYVNVSIIDKEAVLKVAREKQIDGIMSFGVDPGVVSASYVQNEMGLPSFGPFESVEILQNKDKFRAYLKENGFNVPWAFGFASKEEVYESRVKFSYPLIVKPTDSAGSKGCTRVDSEADLQKAIDYAFRFSISGHVIIEQFLDKQGCSSDTDCYTENGILKYVSFNAQRFDVNATNPYTPAAYSWPSTFTKEQEEYLTNEIQRLITLLKMRTCVFNIETCVTTDGKPYIMELTPRGGGNRLCEMIRYATGVDMITAVTRYVVGDEPSMIEQKPYNGHWAEVILHADKSGCFEKLEIDSSLDAEIVENDLWVKKGDIVYPFEGAQNAIGTLVLKFDTFDQLEQVMNNVSNIVRIITTQCVYNKKQKRLMLLGGLSYILPVIEEAHKLGAYVITADYLPDNIAHKYSDEYCNVSIIDKEATLKEAKRLQIDGILSHAVDPGVVTAAYVAEQMGLPFQCSYESACILQDKSLFRKFLSENGFNCAKAKGYNNIEDALKDVDYFNWPVIVKPVDSAGSKGVTKVEDKTKLREAIGYALDESHKGWFIIEDFLEKQGFSVGSESFVVNGELKYNGFYDQYFDNEAVNPHAPSAEVWPSIMPKECLDEVKSELQRLISLLGITTGLFNVEFRQCTNGKVYLMEVSPRAGGNRLAEMLNYAADVNINEAETRKALGYEVSDIHEPNYKGHFAILVLHSDKEGKFESVIIDEIFEESHLIEKEIRIEKGANVCAFTGANAAIGTLFLKFDTREELAYALENQSEWLNINVE